MKLVAASLCHKKEKKAVVHSPLGQPFEEVISAFSKE